MKRCTICGVEKPISEFHRRPSRACGVYSRCKKCDNIRNAIWRKKNKASSARHTRNWRHKNPERAIYHTRKWQAKNPDKVREYARRSNANQRRTNEGKLLQSLRTRISQTIRGSKSNRTVLLLGCSIESFKIYLESLWEVGMSWDNYGKGISKWSIDHIILCALFDMSKPDHQFRCFHFSNMQTMWTVENSRKRDKCLNPP